MLVFRKIILIIAPIVFLIVLLGEYIDHSLSRIHADNQIGKINGVMDGSLDPALTIWGASTTWKAFDATAISKSLSVRTFNMGIDGTSFPQYKGVLEHYIETCENCKYVVLGINLIEFKTRHGLYEPYKFYHHVDNQFVYDALYELNPNTVRNLKYVPGYQIMAADANTYKYVLGVGWEKPSKLGFNATTKTWETNIRKVPSQIYLDEEYLSEFERIIKKAENKGIIPLVTILPFYSEGQEKVSNLSILQERVEQMNVLVLNYLDHEVSTDKDNFYDFMHMNASGAALFTEIFSADFQEIIDHQN